MPRVASTVLPLRVRHDFRKAPHDTSRHVPFLGKGAITPFGFRPFDG